MWPFTLLFSTMKRDYKYEDLLIIIVIDISFFHDLMVYFVAVLKVLVEIQTAVVLCEILH